MFHTLFFCESSTVQPYGSKAYQTCASYDGTRTYRRMDVDTHKKQTSKYKMTLWSFGCVEYRRVFVVTHNNLA